MTKQRAYEVLGVPVPPAWYMAYYEASQLQGVSIGRLALADMAKGRGEPTPDMPRGRVGRPRGRKTARR